MKIAGVILVLLGVLALVYGGFTYVEDRHEAEIGSLEFAVNEKERVDIPMWVGISAAAVGVAMIVYGARRSR